MIRTEIRLKIKSYSFFFSHPDFTVGFGIAPNQLLLARGLYRRSGITPCPEELYLLSYVYVSYYNALFVGFQVFFEIGFLCILLYLFIYLHQSGVNI